MNQPKSLTNSGTMQPQVTFCVYTEGENLLCLGRCLESIQQFNDRRDYRLIVGCNMGGPQVEAFLSDRKLKGDLDEFYTSSININRAPMMKRMFEHVHTDFIWWLNDFVYLTSADALKVRLELAFKSVSSTVLWSKLFYQSSIYDYGFDPEEFAKQAPWFRGLPPPSWLPGGKGVESCRGSPGGDGRWHFPHDGCFFIRTEAVRKLCWPNPSSIKRKDPVLLAEAIRQQGWTMHDIDMPGVGIQRTPPVQRAEDPDTLDQIPVTEGGPDLGGFFSDREIDAYRCLFHRLSGGTVVHLGVHKGRALSVILDVCRKNGNRVIAIDPWTNARIEKIFEENLIKLGHSQTVQKITNDPRKAFQSFQDRSIDLLFCEMGSKPFSKEDFLRWLPKMKPTGYICGLNFTTDLDVRQVVLDTFGNRVSLPGGSLWVVGPEITFGHSESKGCLFIPTHADTALLVENFSGRPELTQGIDLHVFDDNSDVLTSRELVTLCESNAWFYHKPAREKHGDLCKMGGNSVLIARLSYECFTHLGPAYDFVIKVDTDTCLIAPDWHAEFANLLHGQCAIVGTWESRAACEVKHYERIAASHGLKHTFPDPVVHVQGGLYGISKEGILRLANMGFLEGQHIGYAEDGYISYSAQMMGLDLLQTTTVGSWPSLKRPKLEFISHLKAIHSLKRSKWDEFMKTESESLKFSNI